MRRSNVPKTLVAAKNCDPNSTLTINDIQTNALEEHWPNHHIRKAIKQQTDKLQSIQPPNQYIPSQLHDITNSPLGINLAEKFEPRITLLGQGLRAERNSDLWGGMLFRVLSDEDKDPTNITIQYIYTWLQQKLPFSFWNWLIPLIVLIIISVYINTDTLIYRPDWETIEGASSVILIPIGNFLPTEEFITPISKLVTTEFYPFIPFVLSLIVLLVGGYDLGSALIRRQVLSQRSLIFLALGGVLFVSLSIEHFIWSTPLTTIVVSHSTRGSDITVSNFRIGFVTFILVSIFLFSAAFIKYQDKVLTISWLNKIVSKLRKLVGIHAMDYAPIFVYLEKDQEKKPQNSKWKIENIKWDRLHYCIKELTKTKISERYKNSLTDNYHFVIKGNWHSFELISPDKSTKYTRYWWISSITFTGLLIGTILVTIFNFNFIGYVENLTFGILKDQNLSKLLTLFIYKFLYSFLIIFTLIYSITRRPTDLDIDQDFSEVRFYHLTCKKLQVLWNLADDAEFLIQEKLQDPIAGTKGEGAKSFYKTGHTKEKVCKKSKSGK